MDTVSFERVYDSFQKFHAFFAASFGRKQWREHSRNYLQALLVQAQERRNAENLSESVGISARTMQRSLTEARWSGDAVIGRLQEYLAPRLGHPEAVWVFDGSDFPKQGGNRREWPGSTAAGWAKWPTLRRECFWPTSARWASARWAGRWWTNGCICLGVGPRIRGAVRRRGCRRSAGAAQ